ncbi:MAG: phosphotransferase family protein [Acidobacteria bacterium]|nr:phosphotransferase family protein [Acidobacteriota bacterium]
MPSDPELIAIRPDEQLDLSRLEPWLRDHLPETDGALEVEQFGGGHANLTYLLRFGTREYVLRRPPLGPVAPGSHDMGREHQVLERLGDVFPLAPRSYVLCQDPEVLGVDFHVLERRHGQVIRQQMPEVFRDDPALNRRIGEMLVDVLGELHGVDPAAGGLGGLGRPDGFLARQMAGWTSRWDVARSEDVADVQRMISWLGSEPPGAQKTTLVHNDFKLDNVLVSWDDPATPVAVLDWDMTTRGDPLADLGFLLSFWTAANDPPHWQAAARMPTEQPGFPSRVEVIERYAQRTGLDTSRADWYHVFGVFKLLVIVQQIYIRFVRGQTQDQRFAGYGRRVRDLARKGIDLIDGAK